MIKLNTTVYFNFGGSHKTPWPLIKHSLSMSYDPCESHYKTDKLDPNPASNKYLHDDLDIEVIDWVVQNKYQAIGAHMNKLSFILIFMRMAEHKDNDLRTWYKKGDI